MTTMNVSLPEQMKDWVESLVNKGQYHNASEYVRDLIRKDQGKAEKLKAYQDAIQLGRDSGADPRSPDQIIADIKAKHLK